MTYLSLATAATGSAGSVVVAPGAGQKANDLREVRICISASTTITGTPSGWSAISNAVVATTRRLYTYQRTGTLDEASEPSSTFTFSATAVYGCLLFHLRDYDPTPYNVSPLYASNATAGTSMIASTLTPTKPVLLVHTFHQFSASSNPTFTAPGGMTEQAFITGSSIFGQACGIYTETVYMSGVAVGTRTATSTQSAAWAASSSAFGAPSGKFFPASEPGHHLDELAARREQRDGWRRRESGIYCREAA